MANSKQTTVDGQIVDGSDPPHPTKIADREAIVRKGFAARGWQADILASDEQTRRTVMQVAKGGKTYKLDIFAFPNLAWAHRNVEEKRIQITRDYAEHKREFELPNTGEERCLLLGFYTQEQKTVICAWDPGAYKDHANPTSCYVRISALAEAMRNGFGQSIDSKQRLVCCFEPDLIAYYVENMRDLHDRVMVDKDLIAVAVNREIGTSKPAADRLALEVNPVPPAIFRNRILYGAPGTGKSFQLDIQVKEYFGSEELHERVTFHPDYTYGQFVGTYRPTPKYRDVGSVLFGPDKVTEAGTFEPVIDYTFVPGPFLRLLVLAIKNPSHNFALIIEELNRANAPAVFGEVFQLLDRDNEGLGAFTVSMPAEAQDYLRSNGLEPSVRLPANFYLWATMNSADQGVMPLDSAFKRRWSFEYVPLDQDQDKTADWQIHLNFLGGKILWNAFRAKLNGHLRTRGVPEDRLIGPFFMRKDELDGDHAFKNKLLLYLRDDVVRHNPENLFKGNAPSYGALVDAYDRGEQIFADGIDFGAVVAAA